MVPHEHCRLGGVLAILVHSYPGRQAVAARVCSGESSAKHGVTYTTAQLMYAKRNKLIKETGEDVAGDDVRRPGNTRQSPTTTRTHHTLTPTRVPPLPPRAAASTPPARTHARTASSPRPLLV
jgi:hypothetical protein